jgi:Na+-transporting methylmalonyl-CoA/oxaloacetate decarboxylase gamma subunit
VLGAAVVVIVLALLLDALFGVVTHVVDRVIPAGRPAARPKKTRDLPLRQIVVAGASADSGKG